MKTLTDLIDPARRFTVVHGDRRAIRIERRYDAGVADLWHACTEPERLARWLGVLRSVPAEGERAELEVSSGDVAAVTVQRCDPPRRLVATWSWPGEQDTLLDLRIEADGRGARLTFEHLALPVGAAAESGRGWDGLLVRLAAHLSDPEGPVPSTGQLDALTLPLWPAAVDDRADRWPRIDRDAALIEAERTVGADPASVWAALTEPDRLGAWFGVVGGDRSAWTIAYDNGTASGTVRECVPGRRLVTSWRWDFEASDVPDSTLTVELIAAAEGTTVRLRHEGVTGPIVGYGAGWFAHLEAFAATLAGHRPTDADWQADWSIASAMMR